MKTKTPSFSPLHGPVKHSCRTPVSPHLQLHSLHQKQARMDANTLQIQCKCRSRWVMETLPTASSGFYFLMGKPLPMKTELGTTSHFKIKYRDKRREGPYLPRPDMSPLIGKPDLGVLTNNSRVSQPFLLLCKASCLDLLKPSCMSKTSGQDMDRYPCPRPATSCCIIFLV